MSQGGPKSSSGTGAAAIETLTGNSGGAVSPDASFNIDIQGNNTSGIDIVGTPASNLLTVVGTQASTTQRGTTEYATAIETGTLTDSTRTITPAGLAPALVSKYVVDAAGGGAYTTIQSAIDAANAAGGGYIFVQDGTYVENLTLYPDISISGAQILAGYPGDPASCIIQGNHTPATSGAMTFNNITFITTVGDTFNSAVAGTAELNFTNAGCGVTDGYFLNVPNWTGIISFWDFNPSLGTNDGGIYNTAGAPVYCYEAGIGIGTTHTMTVSGVIVFNQGEIMCPLALGTGVTGDFANDIFGGTITLSGNASCQFHHCYHHTGATAAIVMSSTATNTFANSVILSTNNPAIDGAGAGTLNLNNITYESDANVANTLTLGLAGTTENDTFYAQTVNVGSRSPSNPYNIAIEASTAGLIGESIQNTSNNASAGANLQIIVEPGAFDAQTLYSVNGAATWTSGIDNSASDAYVIAASSTLGTSNVVSMSTGGAVSCVLGNFDTTRSNSGSDVSITTSNTSNTATSSATNYLTVAGTTAADPRVQYAVSGTTTWTEGIDNSDSDAYVISASSALGTTNVVRASTAGEINYPLQPAFLVQTSTTLSNVTGDGTTYTVVWDVEVFDQNSDFASNTFTAPVTGRYAFYCTLYVSSLGAAHTAGEIRVVTSNRSYLGIGGSYGAMRNSNNILPVNVSCFADMDSGDTATITLTIYNSTKTVGILGNDTVNNISFFGGYLVC